MAERNITIERLREAFRYEPETGKLYWLISRRGQAKPGDEAGCASNGYRVTKLDGSVLMVHRVGWALTHGCWPAGDLDHKDGDPGNNRLDNLREGSRALNMQNRRRAQSNSRSGLIGVWRINRNLARPWVAAVVIDRKQVWRERFSTKEEGHAAYLAAKARLHPFNTLKESTQ